ncbi:MAG: hypothetical protein IPP32_16150 [Bacteroidetes bacterium]|nr:hypothetical protein [Bacteroidota bacterium]
MNPLPIRSFWLSSILFIWMGCASNSYKNLSLKESAIIDSTLLPSLFKNCNPAPLYKANVNLYGKKFGGLLLIKNMPDSSYRFVFTTETGIKLFDFELKNDSFKVHFCIEKFNKAGVLQTLASDLKLVLTENRIGQNAQILSATDNKWTIYKFSSGQVQEYYYKDISSGRISKIEQSSGKKKKVVIALSNYKTRIPAQVNIDHKNIRLKIDLTLMDR